MGTHALVFPSLSLSFVLEVLLLDAALLVSLGYAIGHFTSRLFLRRRWSLRLRSEGLGRDLTISVILTAIKSHVRHWRVSTSILEAHRLMMSIYGLLHWILVVVSCCEALRIRDLWIRCLLVCCVGGLR